MRTSLRTVLIALSCLATASGALAQSGPPPADWLNRAGTAIGQERYGEALDLLEPAAARGEAEAHLLLAELYLSGQGVPQNFPAAISHYRRAAAGGSLVATNALGRAYAEGLAVAADPALAMEYLGRAAQSGEAGYQFDYAKALESGLGAGTRPAEAAQWYRRAAEQGHVAAGTSLGVLYLEGRGVERDPARAIELFELAIEAGDARAQNNLGLVYVRGEDVDRDYDRAFELFSAAAAQELGEALTNLSVMYASGYGVAVDEVESRRLLEQARQAGGQALDTLLAAIGIPYDVRLVAPEQTAAISPAAEQAARAGDPVALYQTAFQYLEGSGVRQNMPLGLSRMEQAARAGLGPAQFALGLMYANGLGVPQDYESAYVWTSLAALSAVIGAPEVRNALALQMSPGQLQVAQQRVESGRSGGN